MPTRDLTQKGHFCQSPQTGEVIEELVMSLAIEIYNGEFLRLP
jgi:hypothetical protein